MYVIVTVTSFLADTLNSAVAGETTTLLHIHRQCEPVFSWTVVNDHSWIRIARMFGRLDALVMLTSPLGSQFLSLFLLHTPPTHHGHTNTDTQHTHVCTHACMRAHTHTHTHTHSSVHGDDSSTILLMKPTVDPNSLPSEHRDTQYS